MQNDKVYAQKGSQITAFTPVIWKGMGKNKNGWQAITEEQYLALKAQKETGSPLTGASNSQAPKPVQVETQYRALFEQAKGLEADGKLELALDKLLKAHAIKPSPNLKGRINKLEAKVDRLQLVAMADGAMEEGDVAGAVNAYEAAQALSEDEATAAKLAAAKVKLEEEEGDLIE